MLPSVLPIRYLLNPKADPSRPYGAEQEEVLNRRAHETAFREVSSLPGYAPTPLRKLKGMAEALGMETLWYKDEGSRLGIGSFKALGGIYGVYRVLQLHQAQKSGPLSDFTVTCASVGNHGRAVARGAQIFGCRAVVFLPSHTSPHRVEAIEQLGARTVPVHGTFDDAVVMAAREGENNGWSVVADTTFPGYQEVPRHIMQGYTVMAREVLEQLPRGLLPTHVFLQAGVGGLAAAVAGHFWDHLGERRPRVVIVEPAAADCLLESALGASPTPAVGDLRTSMECLACREVSGLAWKILEKGADAFLTIPDFAAEDTVALLAKGLSEDPFVHTQPSGAAGLAGLIAASFEPTLAAPLGLGKNSRILVFGSEGPA